MDERASAAVNHFRRRLLWTAPGGYRRALDIDGRTADAANGLGVLLVEANRPADAVPLFERAVAGHGLRGGGGLHPVRERPLTRPGPLVSSAGRFRQVLNGDLAGRLFALLFELFQGRLELLDACLQLSLMLLVMADRRF